MKTFLLLIMTINADTGEILKRRFEGEPMLLSECIALTIEKGPQRVVNGKATVFSCFNAAAGGSIRT